jgi:hypothetical protein
MKMLFFSADGSEAEVVNRELVSAGIPCEVRQSPAAGGPVAQTASVEVWLRNDADCSRASLLCVQLGVGFATRPIKRPARLWTELDSLVSPRG